MKLYREVKASEETPIGGKTYRLSNNVLYVLEPIEITEIEKAISDVEDMRPYKEAGNRDSYSEYNEGWSDACDILGQAILSKLKGDDK